MGLQKLRRFSKQVNKLSTTQKVVGGLAVFAAGYALVTNSSRVRAPVETAALDEPPPPVARTTPNPTPPAPAPNSRRGKPNSHAKRVPFSEEHP
ncbi:MAG: hypothetical protein NVS3B25_15320 [Hymenobacter sp.]